MQPRIGVVIPTYNARSSITPMIKKVIGINKNILVVIVDDNSPDKTANEVKRTFFKNKHVLILKRKTKGGRGSAVLFGYNFLYKNTSCEYFIEMDADLCHDPKYISIFIKKAKKYEIVIASRYLKKSEIVGWKLKRRLFSKLVNTFMKLVLALPISDYTNGYRCYTRNAIAILTKTTITTKGFIVLSETLFRLAQKNVLIGEIPIRFETPNQHESNLNIQELREAIVLIMRLKFEQIICFSKEIFGISKLLP